MAQSRRIPSLARFATALNPPDAVAVRLFADDGTEQAVSIPRSKIAVLVIELLRQSGRLPPQIEMQRANVTGVIPLSAVRAGAAWGPGGQRGIAIVLQGGLTLTLAMTDEVLKELQHALDRLEETPPPTPTPH